MDSMIQEFFENSRLSHAAYAKDLFSGMPESIYIDALKGADFSQKQAEDFVEVYEVVDQQVNTASGFSAAIFRNKETENYVFSVRGTEMPDFGLDFDSARDWATNLGGIGGEGIAINQMLDMYNYYLRLTAKAGESVLQYSYDSEWQQIIVNSFAAQEDGLLVGETFDVTGHSLGGHLATILGRLAPSAVEAVYTYNAPGFDPPATNPEPGSDFFFNELRDIEIAIQGDSNIASTFDISKNNHLVVPDDIVHRLGITGVIPGTQLEHFSEGTGPKSSHSIANLTDALAVYELLGRVDPDKSVGQILHLGTDILEAASNEAEASLEAVVNGLGKIFRAGPKVAVGNREQLYTSISVICEAIADQDSLQLVSLANLSADTIRARAAADSEEGFAYRHALQNLLPFTVLGDASLYDREALAAEHFSQDYLADRAEFLFNKMALAVDDQSKGSGGLDPRVYEDRALLAQGEEATVAFNRPTAGPGPNITDRHIIFTSSHAGQEAVAEGGDRDDRLYGFLGDDTLDGGKGADHLEGGPGDDTLHGVDPGGQFVQRQDTLIGGADMDTYHPGRNDVIHDSDGKGRLFLSDGTEISNRRFLREFGSDDVFVSADSDGIRLRLTSGSQDGLSTLTVLGAEQFTIEAFNRARHDFGIELPDAAPDDIERPLTLGSEVDDSLGNLSGGDGNDEIRALAGDDRAFGGAGTDLLLGGDGNDILEGGDGNDQLSGDAGRDLLAGDAGNDNLNGGAGQDLISGGDGDDIASGGADNDLLAGGPGSDVLSGGDGNDLIVANIAAGAFDTDWSFTRNAPANPDNLRDPRNYVLNNIAVNLDAFNNPGLIDETAPNLLSIEAGTI